MFNAFRKSSQNVSSSIHQNSEREIKEKENNEITVKIMASENNSEDS